MRVRRPWVRALASLAMAGLVLLAGCMTVDTSEPDSGAKQQIERRQLEISVDGTAFQLSYLQAGAPTGRRLVFVHGTPGSAGAFQPYLTYPLAPYDMVSVDRPGFGRTRPQRAVVSLETQARVLEPLLTVGEAGARPILVGHSLGGPIIAKAAALFPDRVGGIVIVAGSLDPALEKILAIQHLGDAPPLSWIVPPLLKHSNRELIALKPELERLAADLPQIQAAVSILHGTRDRLVPYENVPFMLASWRDKEQLELVTLPDQNHFILWSHVSEVQSAIDRMARQLAAQGR